MNIQEKGLAFDRWSFEVLKKDHVQKSKKLRRAKEKLKRKAANSIPRDRVESDLARLMTYREALLKEGNYMDSEDFDREWTVMEAEIGLLKRLLGKK